MRLATFGLGAMAFAAACGGGGDEPIGPGGGSGDGGGGGGGGTPLVHAKEVTTGASSFNPVSETIPVNDSIFYKFGGVTHNVTFTPKTGAPENIGNTENATVKRAFQTAGTFDYRCTLHAGMEGQIIVQ